MLLCPTTGLAAEICDCGQVHICPSCELVIHENRDPFANEDACSCETDEERTAQVEEY